MRLLRTGSIGAVHREGKSMSDRTILDDLNDIQAVCVLLRCEGQTYEEVARFLDVPVRRVRSELSICPRWMYDRGTLVSHVAPGHAPTVGLPVRQGECSTNLFGAVSAWPSFVVPASALPPPGSGHQKQEGWNETSRSVLDS